MAITATAYPAIAPKRQINMPFFLPILSESLETYTEPKNHVRKNVPIAIPYKNDPYAGDTSFGKNPCPVCINMIAKIGNAKPCPMTSAKHVKTSEKIALFIYFSVRCSVLMI